LPFPPNVSDPEFTRGEEAELKHVLRSAVENEDTLSVTKQTVDDYRRANKLEDAWEPAWPGISPEADSEQAQALIGTPSGLAIDTA
jgi:hypothetical protein